MNEVLNNMIKHPIRTTIIVGSIATGVATILNAVQKLRK